MESQKKKARVTKRNRKVMNSILSKMKRKLKKMKKRKEQEQKGMVSKASNKKMILKERMKKRKRKKRKTKMRRMRTQRTIVVSKCISNRNSNVSKMKGNIKFVQSSIFYICSWKKQSSINCVAKCNLAIMFNATSRRRVAFTDLPLPFKVQSILQSTYKLKLSNSLILSTTMISPRKLLSNTKQASLEIKGAVMRGMKTNQMISMKECVYLLKIQQLELTGIILTKKSSI